MAKTDKSNMTRGGKDEKYECTLDGSVDFRGRPAVKGRTGGWAAGSLLLVNQGLATLAFFGVGVNLVLFLTRVLQQNNAEAANNVSKWTGTVYIFSLVGAFLSDSYWGRYKTCAIFQAIFVIGLALLSLSTHLLLLKPSGCGDEDLNCGPHSSLQLGIFYFSVYLVALGNGGYQPNIATFGADQFDEEDYAESHSKISFFSYFYLALNLGSLFSNTFLDYFEDKGMWALGFWASAGSAMLALVLFLCGTTRYRHFKPNGNPLTRLCQVIVAASRKWTIRMPLSGEDLYEAEDKEVANSHANGSRKLLHTKGFKFLDRAAVIDPDDFITNNNQSSSRNPWCLCPITQVEELKCVLRLLPIWMTTIIYSVVFTQMASLFVEQGAAMKNNVGGFRIPPASMSAFDITSVALFILFYRRLLTPLISRWKKDRKGLTELQRMGVGLVIAIIAMISAGTVEAYRLKNVCSDCADDSSLSILWQIPQYMLIGASEVFMYVGQLEFFNDQAPDGLKSFGSALCMTSISLGNYVSSLLVTIVMEITSKGNSPGWIPVNLNRGHMDRFYFLLASLTAADLLVFVAIRKLLRCESFSSTPPHSSYKMLSTTVALLQLTFSHLMATSLGNALSALRSAISSHELQAPGPSTILLRGIAIKFPPRSCGSISAAATRTSTGFLCFKNCRYESPDAGLLSDNDFIVLYHAIQHAPPSELAGRVLRDPPIEKLRVFFFIFLRLEAWPRRSLSPPPCVGRRPPLRSTSIARRLPRPKVRAQPPKSRSPPPCLRRSTTEPPQSLDPSPL